MKIGVSLSPFLLCGRAPSARQESLIKDGLDEWLNRLTSAGCTHIELRAVRSDTPEEIVCGAAEAALRAGLSLTVHGALSDEPAEAFWGRLAPIISVQPDLCVTVHSASSREETVSLLRRLGEYAAQYHPRACLALENNRSKKGDNISLVECGGVAQSVSEAAQPNVGTCWDFGHFCWDRAAHPALLPDELPPAEFLTKAVHTHIHSVCSDTTHFPLTMGELPLSQYIRSLMRAGYAGVYNLEPEIERWAESIDAAGEIIRSIEILKDALLTAKEELQ